MRTLALILTTALMATPAAAGETLEERIDRVLDVRPGTALVVSNTNGAVRVSSWDEPRVRIEARKKVEGPRNEVQTLLKELKVEISQRDGAIVVDTKHPHSKDWGFFDFLFGNEVKAHVEYRITVPRAMDLDLETVNGRIEVAEVSGRIDLETTNGRIVVSGCSGTLDAETTNGAIEADLVSVTPGRTMNFETTNGRITLTVPPTLAAEVDAATTNGSINSDLPIATRRVNRNAIRGTLNGGGAALRLRTTNGGINIRTRG